MINSTENIIGLTIVGVLLLIFWIAFTMGGALFSEANSVIGAMSINSSTTLNQTSSYQEVKDMYDNTTSIAYDSITFLLYLFVGLNLFSSYTQKNTITTYAFSLIMSIIAGALMVYMMTQLYDMFVLNSSVINFEQFPYFFFDNFQNMVIANIVAGILSFMFVKREATV